MNNNEKRVSRARKFVAGLALVMAMSGLSGCSFKNGNNNDNNQSIENTIESEQDITSEVVVPEIETEDNKETNEEENQDNHEENQEIDPSTTIVDEEPTIVPNHEHETEIDLEIPNIGDYNGYSIVEALIAVGYPSDYNTRKELATILGIENYRGTAEQNLELIRLLKEYADSLVVNPPVEENPIEEEVHTHQYVLNPVIYTITNCGDAGHMITYQFECSCGDKYNKNSDIENHNLHTETTHEDENSDGYYLVTTAVCSDCSYRKEVSRTYVDIRDDEDEEECEHNNTHEVKRAVNISEEGHDINVYRVCNECGHKDFVRTYHVTHEFVEQAPVRENVNGCTYESVVYKTCYCADCNTTFRIEVSRTPMGSHNLLEDTKTSEDGKFTIKYEYCTNCDYEKELSRTPITTECEHKYEDKEVVESINDTEHKRTTYRECSVCHDKIDEVSSVENHTIDYRTETTPDGNYSVRYEYCTDPKCNYEKELSKTHINHTFGDWTPTTTKPTPSSEEGKHVMVYTRTCSVCNKTETKEEIKGCTPGEFQYNPKDQRDHKRCTECGRDLYSEEHTHHHYEKIGEGFVESSISGKHNHTITYRCSDCGVEKIEILNENLDCTPGEIKLVTNADGILYEYQNCTVCGRELRSDKHTHNYTSYQDIDENNHSAHCSTCNNDITLPHEYGDNGNCVCGHKKEQVQGHNFIEDWDRVYDNMGNPSLCYTETRHCHDEGCNEQETRTKGHDISSNPSDWKLEGDILDGQEYTCKCSRSGCNYSEYISVEEYESRFGSSTQSITTQSLEPEVETVPQEETVIEEETTGVTQEETTEVTEDETKTETETVTEEVEEEKMEEISEETEEKTEEEQQTEEKEEATPEDSKPEEAQEVQVVAYVEYPYGYNSNRRESAKTLTYTFRV